MLCHLKELVLSNWDYEIALEFLFCTFPSLTFLVSNSEYIPGSVKV